MKFLMLFILYYSQYFDIHVQSVRTTARRRDNFTGVSVKISARGKIKSAPMAKLQPIRTSMMKKIHMATSLRRFPSNESAQEQNRMLPERVLYLCTISLLAQNRNKDIIEWDKDMIWRNGHKLHFDDLIKNSSEDKITMEELQEYIVEELQDYAILAEGEVIEDSEVADVQKLFNCCDADRDGKLNFEEFLKMRTAIDFLFLSFNSVDKWDALTVLVDHKIQDAEDVEQIQIARKRLNQVLTDCGEAPTDDDLKAILDDNDFLEFDQVFDLLSHPPE